MRFALPGKVKNLSKDFIYNILASLLLTGVMQLAVYPFLASRFSDVKYGLILTSMGIVNTIVVSTGNTLNNVRLIVNNSYKNKGLNGDFQLLNVASSIIGVVICSILGVFYLKQSIFVVLLLCLFVIIGSFKCYYCVTFRLILNFKKILVQNFFGAIGYLIGILVLIFFKGDDIWPIPFIISELFQLVYILINSDLYKEEFVCTELFKSTSLKYFILIITGLFGNVVIYLDRLLIYPLLGGDSVSVYTVASVFGKSLGIIMTPIAGVLLGYYSQKNFVMNQKRFWLINAISFIAGVIFILFTMIVSPVLTKIFYSAYYDKAVEYILVANISATIGVMCTITQSAVLKFAPTWLQIIKELAYGGVYILLGLLLLDKYQLWGFCYASLAANIAKLLVLYIIGLLFIGKNKLEISNDDLEVLN